MNHCKKVVHRALLVSMCLAAKPTWSENKVPVTPIPTNSTKNVKSLLLKVSKGEYAPSYISMFEEPIRGAAERPLPLDQETMALVAAGAPCKEPDIPDPSWKPANTGDYWMHKFTDLHVAFPPEQKAVYEDLMAAFRAACHTRWNIAPLLEKENPPILTEQVREKVEEMQSKAHCPDEKNPICAIAMSEVSASVSTIVFTSKQDFALLQLRIHGGGLGDQASWLVFQLINGVWQHRPDWGGALTTHD